jgi:hypothetical protein
LVLTPRIGVFDAKFKTVTDYQSAPPFGHGGRAPAWGAKVEVNGGVYQCSASEASHQFHNRCKLLLESGVEPPDGKHADQVVAPGEELKAPEKPKELDTGYRPIPLWYRPDDWMSY